MEKYYKYSYDGPVLKYDKIVTERWQASTFAPSERKARSNLAYQYKKQYETVLGVKITLPGRVTKDE